ncbi:MAG TPA: Ig-like domain-containing protein, partial [Candidatus Nanoarchaeia archaeon]|nr:Ig-like domain-containing protein [Candidatus Nanoarchaeia archaeon]
MKPIIRDKINRTKRNTGLLLSLIVLILASTTFTLSETPQQKLLYLSVEKPYYEVGEKIILIITAEPINDYELSISSPNSLYKYSGELKSLIEFYPKEPGLHAIEFTSKQTMIVVDSLQFMVGALAETSSLDNLNQESSINPGSSINPESSNSEITQPSNTFISTNKQNYAIGEQVTASVVIPNQENYKLYYEYNGFVQRYMGDFAEIKFMPRGIGTHYLVLKDLDNNEVERHSFEVTEGKIPEITQETTSEPAPIEAEPLPSQGNEKASLKALKGQFKQKEDAVFEFDFDNNELLLGNPKQKGTWNGPGQKITAELLDNKNEKQEVLPEIEQLADGSFIITVPRARAIRPGAYELRVELTTSTETIVEQQGFLWGVLAINIHKSIYLPGEQAFIGMAVLDDSGHMVCDANVTLEIVAPSDNSTILSTSDHTIIVSPQCTFYGVTELPDYYTYYTVGGVGNYTMRLNAITSEGIRNLTDAFVVQESVEFDVERQGPTRTYPEVPYTMSFVIKANKNYTGVIKEFVPESFEITPQPGLTATTINDTNNNTNNDAQELSWQVKMVQGQTYSYGYEFDAPSTSPLLLTLGALEIGTWKEAREWLIANDGTLIDNNNTVNDTRIIEGETIRVDTQYDSYKNDVYHIQLNHSGTKILDDVCTGGAKFYIASVNTTNCAADSDSCTWDSANDYVILVTSATISQRNSHIYWDIMSCGGSADNYTFVCGEGSGSTDPVTCDNLSAIVIVTSLGDSTAPSININSALNNTYKTSTPTIDFNFTDSQSSSANCTLYFNNTAYNRTNNISNNTQANLKVNTSLTGGTYSVYINCTDQSNNIGKSSVINILVDTTPPNTTLDSPANGTNITTSTYTVNATAADAGSGVSTVIFEYRENASESWKSACTDTTPDGSSYSCTWSLSGLSEQSTYQVRARVNDSVGNYGNNDTHTGIGVFRVPDIENVSASPQRVGVGQQVTISADIYDANGISRAWIILTRPDNVNVTSDMTYTSGNTYRFNYTPFITGTYKYTIKANDTQGNLEVLDPYFFVYVDTTVHVMPENESYTNGQDVKLIPGYVNWSTDQESGTQQIKAQGQRITSFTAVGGSIIAGSAGYDTTDGSYSDTTTNNSVYYAVGRDNGPGIGSAESLQAYINLTYNISSIGVSLSSINNIIFGINFCHTNDVTAPITCGSPIDGTANNPVNFDLFNYDANGWETKSTFNQNSSSATEQTINFSVSTTLSKYLSSYYVQARYETDVTLVAYEDAAFAMDYAPIYVNYTKLDNEGSYDYVNYTNIDGTNLTQLKAFDVVITVPYYNGSGSVQAGNKLPDLEVTVYTGSSYTSAGACELNKSLANISSSAFNCTVTVSDTSMINAWKNNTANRRVQIRGIYFDEENGQADAINYTDVRIKYFSGSLIPNHGNYSLSGYLLMRVLKNDSGSYAHIATVVNDTNTSTIRNISAYDILDIGSIWNATSFNTEYYNPGIYTINVSFTDDNGSVIRDDNGISLTGYANFILDYIKINITSPPNNSIQDSEGFDANITLSYYNYASGGMCYDSIDGGSNITMQAINSTFYHNTTTTVSLGTHNITFYCNDTRGYWFASGVHYFNATDQRGPVVNLESPANDSEEPGGDVTFYYNVTDSMSGVQNCTLILDYTNRVNTSYNVTENTTLNFTVTGLSYENHVWQIECYDNSTSNNKGLSSVYKFLIGNDTEPPDVTLLDPEPSYNTTTPDLVFSYTVVDTLSGIANCSLIINGSVNQTNSTILTGETAVNYFRQYFEIGSYNWSVNCTDIRNNEGASES